MGDLAKARRSVLDAPLTFPSPVTYFSIFSTVSTVRSKHQAPTGEIRHEPMKT
jgi:hypothetical protein